MRINVITSPTNQTIKDLVRLKDRKGERADHAFVVEGRREIERANRCGFVMIEFFWNSELASHPDDLVTDPNILRHQVSAEAFQKIAMREGRDGVIAVFETRTVTLQDLSVRLKMTPKPAFIVAVECLEKPGNLGAILRTADAAAVDAVVVLDDTVDTWNQNVIRSSLGGVFSVSVVAATSEEFYSWCCTQKVQTVAAALSDRSESIFAQKMIDPTAVVLGSEANGLSEFWMKHANHLALIPMHGVCDSLNVSVAAAVFIYEIVRQRR